MGVWGGVVCGGGVHVQCYGVCVCVGGARTGLLGGGCKGTVKDSISLSIGNGTKHDPGVYDTLFGQ